MIGELVPQSIREIELAAAREIQKYVLARIGKVEIFPTARLRGENGHLTDHAGVIVDHGVPEEETPDYVVRDAVVLLPGGLFVGKPIQTPTEDGRYSLTVPDINQLEPASPEIYLIYGERALTTLDVIIQAQVPH